ncbi:MAG: hypothetical protein ACJAUO_002632, partial [Sediminicola sp.]
MQKSFLSIGKAIIVLVVINVIGHYLYTRFDLTEDKRYTLSQPAISSVQDFQYPVVIDVLLDGNL